MKLYSQIFDLYCYAYRIITTMNMKNNTAATTRILNINLKYVEVLCFFFVLRLLVMMFVRPVLSVTNTKMVL